MANAKKLPSGSWRVNAFIGVDENGKQIRKSFTAPTKREAELMAAQYLTKKHHEAAPENMTLGQAIDKYIESKSNILSPSTIRGYTDVRRVAFKDIMDRPLDKLNEVDCQRAVNQYSANHSPKSVTNAWGLVASSLSMFAPAIKITVALPQKQKPEIRIPTKDEVAVLIEASVDTVMEIPILLAALLGLRRSEICALKWSDVDFKKNTIFIQRAIVYGADGKRHEKATKTTAGTRLLSVAPEVMKRLQSQKKDTDFVCTLTPYTITDKFTHLLEKLGIEPFRFHDLRHPYVKPKTKKYENFFGEYRRNTLQANGRPLLMPCWAWV